jgi:prepilin-type N-terminal cleavage/methylation domain-containing protein
VTTERTDHGFTLVELVVVITLMALIATVITAVVAVVLRTTDPTDQRIAQANATRGLSTWLTRDLASAPSDGIFVYPSGGSPCVGEGSGVDLVRLQWDDGSVGSPVTFVVGYRWESDGPTAMRIRRYTCSPAGTAATSTVIARSLVVDPPLVTSITSPTSPVPRVIGVKISTKVRPDATSGPALAVNASATSRNPGATLPPSTP